MVVVPPQLCLLVYNPHEYYSNIHHANHRIHQVTGTNLAKD